MSNNQYFDIETNEMKNMTVRKEEKEKSENSCKFCNLRKIILSFPSTRFCNQYRSIYIIKNAMQIDALSRTLRETCACRVNKFGLI